MLLFQFFSSIDCCSSCKEMCVLFYCLMASRIRTSIICHRVEAFGFVAVVVSVCDDLFLYFLMILGAFCCWWWCIFIYKTFLFLHSDPIYCCRFFSSLFLSIQPTTKTAYSSERALYPYSFVFSSKRIQCACVLVRKTKMKTIIKGKKKVFQRKRSRNNNEKESHTHKDGSTCTLHLNHYT